MVVMIVGIMSHITKIHLYPTLGKSLVKSTFRIDASHTFAMNHSITQHPQSYDCVPQSGISSRYKKTYKVLLRRIEKGHIVNIPLFTNTQTDADQ